MSGFVLFNPILGRQNIPGIFRGGMALVLSVFVASVSMPTVQTPTGIMELCVRLILELALGFALGMVVEFFFYIPQLAGQTIDTQMGLTMNQIYDSNSQENLSVSSVLFNVMMMLLFFAANGHHTLLRIMLTSGEVVPYGAAHLGTEVLEALLQLFVECTLLAVKLCLPILSAELIGQVGMGILMKVIPQINVFSINIELKVLIGLGLEFLLICPFSEFLLQAESTMLDSIQQVLSLSA
jgi:flagellar biosynthetic protein FliR